MTRLAHFSKLAFGRIRGVALAATLAGVLTAIAVQPAPAQTFSVLYDFSLQSGWQPYGGVTRDRAGNLYGTTTGGGVDAGTVYELKRLNGSWILNRLFAFNPISLSSQIVGWWPYSGVVFGPDGALYGTTLGGGIGGGSNGYGVVYKLTPPATPCKSALCLWGQTVLYEFTGGSDGSFPALGNVTFDSDGNLYGTTSQGGSANAGTVYELTPSNGGWTEKVLYSFAGGNDGSQPYSGVALDTAGNLYGTTTAGGGSGCSGQGCGIVYELSPSGSGWTERILYAFQGTSDGYNPFGGLTFDQAGNLYGSTSFGGSSGGGTVFELSPAGGSWNYSLLYSLGPDPYDLGGPFGNLFIDAAGSVFGTTDGDGTDGLGTVFRLKPQNGGWTYTLLHSFDGTDGLEPLGGPIVDAMGFIYGTTSEGGVENCEFEVNCGTVWQIAP